MSAALRVTIGQHSDKGRKAINQDFHGACVPATRQLDTKGIAIALADGISSSAVAHVASAAAVRSFLEDYYATAQAWTVKKAAQRVLMATNSWLHAQTRSSPYRYDRDRGYVCTLSALVLKGCRAHLFHVGDSRIYRLRGQELEQLTQDHRVYVTREQSYLGRALGLDAHLDIDYLSLALEVGDVFLLATDGVYEYLDAATLIAALAAGEDLDALAQQLVTAAFRRGSPDNLTLQLVRIEALPAQDAEAVRQQIAEWPLPPLLDAGRDFDGYRILRELHASARSHVYLAEDRDSGARLVLKIPPPSLRDDAAHLERLLLEEWIARRIDNPHVLKAAAQPRPHHFLYVTFEYLEGQSLRQWLLDHPRPPLETVRGIVEQIAKGLRAFHRLEMLHQDLRPDNVIIDAHGTVKIIDFGAVRVAGLLETAAPLAGEAILGTEQYTAPEYFLGENGSLRSDLYSLGVITYEMLSGRLPYGTAVPGARTPAAQRRLRYRSVLDEQREIPAWLDATLRKAVQPNPQLRYADVAEFVHDLRQPNAEFLRATRPALIERHPAAFWKGVSALLAVLIVLLLVGGHLRG